MLKIFTKLPPSFSSNTANTAAGQCGLSRKTDVIVADWSVPERNSRSILERTRVDVWFEYCRGQ